MASAEQPIGSVHIDTLAMLETLKPSDHGAKIWPASRSRFDQSYRPVYAYVAPPLVTDAMIAAYLEANTAYWVRADETPPERRDPSSWRAGTPKEATRAGLEAALLAARGKA